jgi:acyl CoA:acetate/3-ketoacid CoA transferase alpha subunit/acyl CoA:acetate/3-ketoacid CoA transferase beta subunit
MDKNLRQFIESKIDFPEGKGPGKIMDLSEAIRRFIAPRMAIHAGNGYAFPTAAYYEIVRQFWGKSPDFTLIAAIGGATSVAIFVHGGLCRKIISTFLGDGYPFPSPNPILVKGLQEGRVIFENWTMLSLNLRLLAGAMGLPFLPTKSIWGSTMEKENQGTFCLLKNPFAEGNSVGLVSALDPDISLAHGWAADPEGNTLIAAPFAGNVYGALAAKKGVIVTVEKIVDAEFIRRYSFLAKIPGYVVKAVCPAPFGAHPVGHHPLGIPEFEGYGEDQEFIMEARQASRDPSQYQAWVQKWILECKDHGEFLARLGHRRIWYLKGRIHSDSWISELSEYSGKLSSPEEATPAERMIIGASRKLKERIKEKNYQIILAGIGASNLAAWLTYYELRREGFPLELIAEVGFFGYSPRLADPFIFNLRNLPTCRMNTDILTTMGIFLSGSQNPTIGVIGAGQVDRFGNVNTTVIPKVGYLVGSGGANDVASGAKEVMVTLEQSRSRYVEKVPYITSPGSRVTTVVSQWGIFEKALGDEELMLTYCFLPGPQKPEEEVVREMKEQCGWVLKVHPRLQSLSPPSPEELKFLRCFDPRRFFLGGERAKGADEGRKRD